MNLPRFRRRKPPMSRGSGRFLRVARAVVLVCGAFGASEAVAQSRGGAPLQAPSSSAPQVPAGRAITGSPGSTLLAPGVGGPGAQVVQSAPGAAAPPAPAQPGMRAGEGALQLLARFGRDTPAISAGLHWRVYADRPDPTGAFRL